MDLDVTSLHHRRAVRRWERMSVGDLIERVTWSRPDKPAIVGRPGAYADERLASLTSLPGRHGWSRSALQPRRLL